VVVEVEEEHHEDADPAGGGKLREHGFGQLTFFSLHLFS